MAARVCRRFPEILELLASGSLSFSTVRMLKPHLTVSNHETVLARAVNRTRQEIEGLVAELAPRPDVAVSVRKLPCSSKNNEDGVMSPTGSPGPTAPDVAYPLLGARSSGGGNHGGFPGHSRDQADADDRFIRVDPEC